MNLQEITEALMTKYPGAKFSVWDEQPDFPPENDTSVVRHIMDNKVICWSKLNLDQNPNLL